MIPMAWQPLSCSLSGHCLVKYAEIISAACRPPYLQTADRFRSAVEEFLKTKIMLFPRQIVFKSSGQLYIFFDGSLQGYGACIYMKSNGQFNLLISSAKIMGKAAYTAPQSEICRAVVSVKMEWKITLELTNINLSYLCSSVIPKSCSR